MHLSKLLPLTYRNVKLHGGGGGLIDYYFKKIQMSNRLY